jgi:GT2 family glycosyltransferase
MDLSIIILNYNTKETTAVCLESVLKSEYGNYKYEIFLVDNASTDNSIDFIKSKIKSDKLKFIKNSVNIGFSAGNNKGIRQAKGEHILLLNSDIILGKNTIIKQLQFIKENPEYAVLTCKLELVNGKMDPACHRGFPTPWNSFCYFSKLEKFFGRIKFFGGYHQVWKDINKYHEVDVISGAFFLVKKEVLDKVGLFDEGFFMYGEDIDLCLRIRQAGYKIAFNPETTALHLKGESGKNARIQNSEVRNQSSKYFWETMKLFYQKHYANKYPRFFMWLIFKVIDWKKKY